MKAGIKSTELWLIVIAVIGQILPQAMGWVSEYSWGQGLLAGLAGVYAMCRTLLKKEQAGTLDLLTPEQEKILAAAVDAGQPIAEVADTTDSGDAAA